MMKYIDQKSIKSKIYAFVVFSTLSHYYILEHFTCREFSCQTRDL